MMMMTMMMMITIDWKCSKLMKEYFESKGNVGKCQLLLCLLKSNCLVVVRRILGIKMVRSSKANYHIVRNIQYGFNAIGKTSRTKDICAARHVTIRINCKQFHTVTSPPLKNFLHT